MDSERLNYLIPVSHYSQVACYFCPVAGCEGSSGFKFVRIHIPGAAEQTTVGKVFTCTVCGAVLTEEKSYRRLSGKGCSKIDSLL